MRNDTANWIALADYDLETARHMLETGRYLYIILLCHLSLEKMLKAYATETTISARQNPRFNLSCQNRQTGDSRKLFGLYWKNQHSQHSNPLPRRLAALAEGISKICRKKLFKANCRNYPMVKTTPELKRIVKKYRAQLVKMGIRPTRILLYGSYAMRTAHEGSDIDLIVISSDWAKYNHRKRLELLGVASARILEPVQARGFTPSELKSQTITPFWKQIIKKQAVAV